jgi:SWI/SNF-related matrix-associated actin-dependent regulator of chromatin subfamily A-like protein 1
MKFIADSHGYYIPVNRKPDIPWITQLENTKYLALNKTWFIPPTKANRKFLQEKGLIEHIKHPKNVPMPKELANKLPSNLYDIQKEAIEFIYSRNGSALIAYDMGLGKTAIALCYTSLMDHTTVIICQASLKKQWGKQIETWTDKTYHIIYGTSIYPLPKADYYIINYEILEAHKDNLRICEQIVVDECQFVSNHESIRTKALMELNKHIGRLLALSGTPITRRPKQFYSVLHMLLPTDFTDWYHFAKKYCGLKRNRYGWVADGATNIEELREYLSGVMLRKTKKDSLDIPDKIIIPILLDVNKDDYIIYEESVHDAIKDVFGQGNYLKNKRTLVYLQYLAYIGKRAAMFDWMRDFLESGEKLMIFCQHRKVVEDIHKQIGGVIYYGGMSEKQKEASKKAFLTKEQVIIGNIQSMGTGLDGLQHVCHNAAFAELPFTPTTFDQATDRLWRIGQDSDVNIYTLVADGTVENNIIEILARSRKLVYNVLQDPNGEASILADLIKSLRKNNEQPNRSKRTST